MSRYYYDDDNANPVFINSNTTYNGPPVQRVRARHPSDAYQGAQQYIVDDGRQWMPQPGGRRHIRANSAAAPPPAQIIINNENFVEDHPQPQLQPQPQPEYYERPRSRHEHRVVYHDQQIIRVRERSRSRERSRDRNRSRDRDRSAQDDMAYKTRRNNEELERMQHEKAEKELVERVKRDLALAEAKEKEEAAERAEREKQLKEKAVKEWQEKEAAKKREEEEKEKERERIGKEWMRQQLRKDGYTEEEIDELMDKKEKKKRAASPAVSNSTSIVISNRPTYMKVHKKHIDPKTLDEYGIEWEWAEDGYINILRWVSEAEQEILFEHTRKLKEKKYIEFAQVEQVVVKGLAKDRKGRLLMVRKKEEKRERSKSPAQVKRFFI